MKKDKEWLKREIYVEYNDSNFIQLAWDLIDELDEPQKPIIPQFVADYIEEWKNEGLTIYEWFDLDFYNNEDYLVFKWLQDKNSEENNKGDFLLIDSIRYGYEVEVTK